MYLMVLEVVLLGIVVFIIGPILLVSPAIIRLYSDMIYLDNSYSGTYFSSVLVGTHCRLLPSNLK